MCGPALAMFGAFVSAAGTLYSGMAQAQMYRAQQAQYNRQAQIERDRGIFESQRERERHRRVEGEQRAAYLSSGVALEGTPSDVIVDSGQENQIDIEAIKYGAQVREDNARFSAQMAGRNASNAMAGGFIGALSPLIGGFRQMGGTSFRTSFS